MLKSLIYGAAIVSTIVTILIINKVESNSYKKGLEDKNEKR